MDERAMPLDSVRTDVLGVPVDAVSMSSALEMIRGMLAGEGTHVIAAVNPEKVIAAQQNPELLHALEKAALVIPDGIGVVAAARLLRKGSMDRVPGSDFMPAICALAAAEGYGVFLYGAKPGVADEAATLLQERYPGLNVSGTQHGYASDHEMDRVIRDVNNSGASVLFVGLGSPRQELWMEQHRQHLSVRVCQGVGGTFDAICGRPRRAPPAFQKLYLEWFYRLVSEPRRLHRQRALPHFAYQVLRHALAGK